MAGGAGGLGKAIAKYLASQGKSARFPIQMRLHTDDTQGAHVTIFGRTKTALDEAAEDIRRSRLTDSQEIRSVVADLSDRSQVRLRNQGAGSAIPSRSCTNAQASMTYFQGRSCISRRGSSSQRAVLRGGRKPRSKWLSRRYHGRPDVYLHGQ